MEDKRTPMEPAELLEMPEKQPEPQQYYGTSIPEKPKKSHTWLLVILCILLVALGSMVVIDSLFQLRVVKENGKFRLTLTNRDSGESQITAHMGTLTPSGSEDMEQTTQSADTDTNVSLQISAADSQQGLSAKELYSAVNPSVVCITTDGYNGTLTGTGVILTRDGYILTTNDILSGALSVTVTFYDDTTAQATQVGEESTTGIAVIKADADGLTPAQLGDPDSLSVGDRVISIGNPYGAQIHNVLSEGVVSAISTEAVVNGEKMTLLQTTASFGSGNNGCPVINTSGQVVGITTQVGQLLTDSGSDPNLAVSIVSAKQIVENLIHTGYASQSLWLGIEITQIPIQYQIYCDYPGRIWISAVGRNTLASQALCVHDIITEVDGVKVETPEDYYQALSAHEAGDTVRLTIFRAGSWFQIDLPLSAK